MAEIVWTEESISCLENIHDYISRDNEQAALRICENLYNKVQTIGRFLNMGYLYFEDPDRTIRILVYGHYKIAYKQESDDRVIVLGIYHGAMEIENYLKE
jgi:toxin ParE1/3/4